MKEGTKNIVSALIIALGLIIASVIYAYSNRYDVEKSGMYPRRFDKWNNTYEWINEKK